MWFKHRAWVPVAWFLSLGNLAAVWFAARPGEPTHATIHALFAVLFALGAGRLMARHQADARTERSLDAFDQNEHMLDTIDELQPRLQELEERLDFAERLLTKYQRSNHPDAPPR